jgi:SAM-dependent methyltransferase
LATDYEELAERYDEDRARFGVEPDDIVLEFVASRRAARVLDVGCGTGTWLAAQRQVAPDARFCGADPSAGMLAVARRKGLTHLLRAGAERLPLAAAVADYVIANFTFHHWDKEPALDEIRRVLVPGGVFRLNNIEPFTGSGSWVNEFFPETVAIDAARFWPPDRIADELRVRHFAVDVHVDSRSVETSAAEAVADAERRVISQLATLDDAAYERGLAALRRAAEHGATFTGTAATLCLTARLA